LSGTTRLSRYQKKHSPTYHPDYQPIFISFFHLLRSIASSLFKLHAWQSFCTTSLHVLFGLPLGLEPSTSYSIHFFTQSVFSFCNTCPYYRNLFCCSTKTVSSIPSLPQLLTLNSIFYLNTVARENLCAMKRQRRATKLEDIAAANEASQKLAGLYTEKAEEYCRQQGTNISDCFGAVAFAEAWRLINVLSGRKSRPVGTVAGTVAERKSSLRGHFEGLLGGLADAPIPHMETLQKSPLPVYRSRMAKPQVLMGYRWN